MLIKANAKINLTLDIVGKRDDGYHLIDSLMQSVSLCDILTVEKNDEITVLCDNSAITDCDNIATVAAQKFFEFTGICGGAKINIQKNIPVSAGLGGGSADAAAVICALDKIYDTRLPDNALCEIALSVGADVPFCVTGGCARVGGIGEVVDALESKIDYSLVLVKHAKKKSTADMYRRLDGMSQTKKHTSAAVNAVQSGDLNALLQNIGNAFSAVNDNRELVSHIMTTSPMAVSLSGSGPTVFAVYADDCAAAAAADSLSALGYQPIIAHPSKQGIIFE